MHFLAKKHLHLAHVRHNTNVDLEIILFTHDYSLITISKKLHFDSFNLPIKAQNYVSEPIFYFTKKTKTTPSLSLSISCIAAEQSRGQQLHPQFRPLHHQDQPPRPSSHLQPPLTTPWQSSTQPQQTYEVPKLSLHQGMSKPHLFEFWVLKFFLVIGYVFMN